MAVAKRQGRQKPMKIEQRKVRGPEWGPQVKQTRLLAGPIYTGQAQGEKNIKRGAKASFLPFLRTGVLISSRLLLDVTSCLEVEKEMATHSSQCSCLENPRDGGAWWVAIYGVAQSRTWLKRLSSSSSSSLIPPGNHNSPAMASIAAPPVSCIKY